MVDLSFIYCHCQELAELQHFVELVQRRDLLYGIFQFNLEKCTEALLSCILRSCCHIATRCVAYVIFTLL